MTDFIFRPKDGTDASLPAQSHRRGLPMSSQQRAVLCTLLLAASPAIAIDPAVARAETHYAEWLDACYALSTLQAGPTTTIDGRDRPAWEQRKRRQTLLLRHLLPRLGQHRLDPADRAAVAAMTLGVERAPEAPPATTPVEAQTRCAAAVQPSDDRSTLSQDLYACFQSEGNRLAFEGQRITRTTALSLLEQLEQSTRRRALFDALAPLWTAVNGDDSPSSPYRRLVQLSAAEADGRVAAPIARAAEVVGLPPEQVEVTLERVLDTWRRITPATPIEPWDYWHAHTQAARALDAQVPPERILALTTAFYRTLGADLPALGIDHDLVARDGKAPLAYADFVRIGRTIGGRWRPARARVSANVERGGLFVLNEVIHEYGHAVHMEALRTRPAHFDLGDDLYVEAFADVTSWSVAEPAWQRRFLRQSVPAAQSLEALYANVMLDVAWGLFEIRMLKSPDSDPNLLWTDITARYLHVVPHPEVAWWALRVQLVENPGYMINYGLGAVLTADLRRRTRAAIGDFDAGNRRWYRWISRQLLRHGTEVNTATLIRQFLGRGVSTDALLTELARIAPPAAPSTAGP